MIVNEQNELLSELFLMAVIKHPKISLREKGLFYLINPQGYGPSRQGRLGSSQRRRRRQAQEAVRQSASVPGKQNAIENDTELL